MFKKKRGFREFLASTEAISTNILADRLKKLEQHGIVQKRISKKNLSAYDYSLTSKGIDLMPVLLEIAAWSEQHDTLSNAPSGFAKLWRENREGVIAAAKAGEVSI
ncbi:MAG: helix-turn-helix transcriptional regulator [Sneathiellales bacterium]|nr:helix-turn-helix transcriptional regulator [Sneathiellales bacterium]